MATCFWVGGSATWDLTNTGGGGTGGIKWASASGGASAAGGSGTGGCPGTGDSVTFDGSSGGGTVTAAASISGLSLATINMDAFVGTLDFATNNPNLTITNQFSCSGAAVHTLNLGSGTFTLSGANLTVWNLLTTTNLTLNAGTSTLLFNGAPTQGATTRAIQLGSNAKTYSTITITNSGSAGAYTDLAAAGAITVGTLNLNPPVAVRLALSSSFTISNAITWPGTAFNNVVEVIAQPGTSPTLTLSAAGGTAAWAALSGVTFGTNTVTATNSFDMKGNSGVTITGPSGGASGGSIIGS